MIFSIPTSFPPQSNCISLPIMSVQRQIPPIQAAKSHPMLKMNYDYLTESKSPASRSAASMLGDGGPSAETPQEDMFIFSNTTFKDLRDVWDSFDVQEQPEVEVKESASTQMKNAVDSELPALSFRSNCWAPSTPIPGMMQTIRPVPLPEEDFVGKSAFPFSQSLPERVLGLTIVTGDDRFGLVRPYCFRSKFLCQLNPLMLPVMEVHSGALPSDHEWKLRDLLAKRTEKLRVLILFFDESENAETVLSLLGRLSYLLTDVTTVVLGNAPFLVSVYVIDLSFSRNRLDTIAMLLTSFRFQHVNKESFVKTMSTCAARNESLHVIEATVEFDPSLHELASAYPKYPNIYFNSDLASSMSLGMKNELSFLFDESFSGLPINLSEFQNLRTLFCSGRFVTSPLQPSHGLRSLCWFPSKLTGFNDCAWGCLSNLRCLSIDGTKLQAASRISLQCSPRLVSLSLFKIGENIILDFGHLPLRLNDFRLSHFQGSVEKSDQLQIEGVFFKGSVCSDAYLQLCPKSDNVEIEVSDNFDACRLLSFVADQLKGLKLTFGKIDEFVSRPRLQFNAMGTVYPLLESLELVRCSVMLSAATFPRLHHLSLDKCDVLFPKSDIVGLYGDSFPELSSLAMTNCKLLLDSLVPEDEVKDPDCIIHLQANSLFSLKLMDVSNMKMLQIQKQSFPRLRNLHCHVVNDDDFQFNLDSPGVPLFPHMRNLSLKKNALDGKTINLDLLADMCRLERLELLDNAFFTLNDMKPIQRGWVRFSSAVVKHEIARRFPAETPIPMESSAEIATFAIGLVGVHCEKLIIDQHVVCLSDRHLAQSNCISVPMFPIQKQTPPTQAASLNPMSVQKQTPPTPAANAQPVAKTNLDGLAESKSPASRSAASLLDDGGSSAETLEEDMFIFSDATFNHFWDVSDVFDFQEQPEMEVKEQAITKMKNPGDSEPQVSRFRPYIWVPSTPIPGIMQTIVQVPVPEGGRVGESAFPFSPSLPERVLGLTIVACEDRYVILKRYDFRSKFLCRLNPLMLPVMEAHHSYISADEEWKLRDVLAQRKEKLRVLVLLLDKDDDDSNLEAILFLLGRLEDLLSDVTTFVLGNNRTCDGVYVIDLTLSENRLQKIAMLLESFTFYHCDGESLARTMSACTAQNKSWRVVEATVGFDSSLYELVSAYPKSPNIHFSSMSAPSMNREMKHELSSLIDSSETLIDLSEFPNLRSLSCSGRFVNSSLQQSHGLRRLSWFPCGLTGFNDCAWGCLLNLQCLSIAGAKLQPNSRLLLQYFSKLVSLQLEGIRKDVVVDFGHLPLKLNDIHLCNFHGSFEGSDELRIEKLFFSRSVCNVAYLQLCGNSEKVEIKVRDTRNAHGPVCLVAEQLKCLTLSSSDVYGRPPLESLPFSSLGTVFCLLESLELGTCSVMLSAVTFPRLHSLSLNKCDVFFPKRGIPGQYGHSFPILFSLAITNCRLLFERAVHDNDVQDPLGVIHLLANSLVSLKLMNVSNLNKLLIHRYSFPHLQTLQCHVAHDNDFPFPLDESRVPFFPHLRVLSLRKNALDGKKINLDCLADMGRLEKLELLDNAFFTLNDMKLIQCRWVHISPVIVEQEKARRRDPGGMHISVELLAEMVTFAISLVSEQCENLIIDRNICLFRDRADMEKWCPPMYGFKETSIKPTKN